MCIVCQVDDIILCHGNYGMGVYIWHGLGA